MERPAVEEMIESFLPWDQDFAPVFYDECKLARLRLTNGGYVTVEVLGEEAFGSYLDKKVVAPVYSEEAINWLVDQIKYKIEKKFDQVILITGRERSGKSTLGLKLASMLDPDFTLDRLAFTQEEFKELVREAPDESAIVMDEAGVAMFSRDWMTKGQKELIKAFICFGIKRLKAILILPHITMLDYQLRCRRVHWWLSCYCLNGVQRGWFKVRTSCESEFEMGAFWVPKFTTRFTKVDGPLWEEYEKRKREFLDALLSGRSSAEIKNGGAAGEVAREIERPEGRRPRGEERDVGAIVRMLQSGMTMEEVVRRTGLPPEKIESLVVRVKI